MTKIEMVRAALAELGDASSEALAAFVEQKYGVTIERKFIPVFRESVRDKERMEHLRRQRQAAAGTKGSTSVSAMA